MKLNIDASQSVSTGVSNEFEFAFAANAIAFEAYSSKLYTDKARAIIRELSCNAKDAHVAAGTPDRPFEIHLPTNHEPYFSITDYGTGLSHADMKALFALYFGSNKRDSNKFIGALGLGSKSPFAYDGNGGTYSIISRKDGKTRMYVASKVNGLPKMEQLGEEIDTPDAPNGVEIKFAVASKDIWEWENKAKIALEFITPTPIINITNFAVKRYEYSLQNEGKWGLRTEAKTPFGYNVRAIMGNVQYAIGDIDDSQGVTAIQRKILEMPIDMFFGLGELDFAISREALEMKPRTVANILKMADEIYDELIGTVKEKIDAAKYAWEAHLMLFGLINSTSTSAVGGSTMGGLIKAAYDKGLLFGQYKNFFFTDAVTKIDELRYSDITVSVFKQNAGGRRHSNAKRAKKSSLFSIMDGGMRRKARITAKTDDVVARSYQHKIEADNSVCFIVHDLKCPGDKYIHHLLQTPGLASNIKTVYLIHRNDRNVSIADVIREAKKLIGDIGNPTFTPLSEIQAKFAHLDTPRVKNTEPRERREIVVLKSDVGSRYRYTATGWTRAWRKPSDTEMASPKKFYVVLDRLNASTDTNFDNVYSLHEMVGYFKASGKLGMDNDTPIFGIKRGSKLLKENNGEWVALLPHVFTRVKAIMTPKKTLALSLYMTPFSSGPFKDLLNYIAQQKVLATDSPIQQFALALAEADGIKEANWSVFKRVLDFCQSRSKYTPGVTANFNKKWTEVKPLYPMLELLNDYQVSGANAKRTVVNYLRVQDEQNQREALAKAAAAASN